MKMIHRMKTYRAASITLNVNVIKNKMQRMIKMKMKKYRIQKIKLIKLTKILNHKI